MQQQSPNQNFYQTQNQVPTQQVSNQQVPQTSQMQVVPQVPQVPQTEQYYQYQPQQALPTMQELQRQQQQQQQQQQQALQPRMAQPTGQVPPQLVNKQQGTILQPTAPVQAVPNMPSQPVLPTTPTQPEASTDTLAQARRQQLNELMQQEYGFGIDQFEPKYQEYQESQLQQQKTSLGNAWGVSAQDVDNRLQLISQYLDTHPELDRNAYDNEMGVQFLWYQLSQQVQPTPVDQPTASITPTQQQATPAFQYTRSQLMSMPESERRKQHNAIFYAEANNLVYEDLM